MKQLCYFILCAVLLASCHKGKGKKASATTIAPGKSPETALPYSVEADSIKAGQISECGNIREGYTLVYGSATFKSSRRSFQPHCVYYYRRSRTPAELRAPKDPRIAGIFWTSMGAEELLPNSEVSDTLNFAFALDKVKVGSYSDDGKSGTMISIGYRNLFDYKQGELDGKIDVTESKGFPGKVVKVNFKNKRDTLTGEMTFSEPAARFAGQFGQPLRPESGADGQTHADFFKAINAKLPRSRVELQPCMGKGKAPVKNGLVAVHIVVAADGKLVHRNIVASSILDDGVLMCILDKMKSWKFPAAKNKKRPRLAAEYTYKF